MSTVLVAERPDSVDASTLICELDAYLEPLYPRESRHGLSVEQLLHESVAFFVLRRDGSPAGCGGVKICDRDHVGGRDYGEIKRMYVRPRFRGLGLGLLMLRHLADHALQEGVPLLRLETGIHQHEAVALYRRFGFQSIRPFGDYREDPNSLFFEKRLA